jgi:hypothetical protein
MRLRNTLIATTILVAGTLIGATTQHFASADVTSGDRPVLVPIDTCRIADTRAAPDNVGPRSTPLGPAETITIDAQQAGTDCTGQIPATATALSLNVTALNATSNSFITIWSDGPRPTASALNPEPGARVFNAVTTEVTATQTFQIYNNRGNVDVFVDINGYYDNHNHDDLYPQKADVYTSAEVDALLAAQPTVLTAAVAGNGTFVRGSAGVTSSNVGTGRYEVDFGRDMASCTYVATSGNLDLFTIAPSVAQTAPRLNNKRAVYVVIRDLAGSGLNDDFFLTVVC